MLAAVKLTVTGLTVLGGSTTSALVNDPSGAGGAGTPPIALILRLGELASVTEAGAPDDSTPTLLVPTLTDNVLVNASTRKRPGLPPPPPNELVNSPPLPPARLTIPVPVSVVAISRTE